MTKLLIADKNDSTQDSYRALFNNTTSDIVKTCSKGEEVVDYLSNNSVDVAIISLSLGGLDAFETIHKVVFDYPKVAVIIQTSHSEGAFPKRLLETGARGFISLDTEDKDILEAVEVLKTGNRYICPKLSQNIALSMLPGSKQSPLDRLSEREMQVILQLSHGETARDISVRLALSPKTISTYKHRVREKLSLSDTQEMFKLVGAHGLR